MGNVVEVLIEVASFLGAIALLLGFIALGWYALWRTSLRKLNFIQELMGNRKPSKESREAIAAEIERLKRQHSSRPAAPRRSPVSRQGSMASRSSSTDGLASINRPSVE